MNDLEKLQTLLNDSELSELVKAIKTVMNQGEGFGEIGITIAKRRVKLISVTRSLKPGNTNRVEGN